MFWADELVKDLTERQHVNDSWTPSGMIHMGGLKGPVIHDVLAKVLKEKGIETRFTYGFDDADPLDGLPPELKESHSKYLGLPIKDTPAPDFNGTFGEYFGNIMQSLQERLGIHAEIYTTSDLYKKGFFNDAITFILDHADKVRQVYADIYKKEMPNDWYPLQVICPDCGKLGTTKVTGWDGKEVTYICAPDLVVWAKGCESTGKRDPYDGRSKIPWKVEWASKWWTFGVTIEGAGKDHASSGGSYDVAMKIVQDVFGKKPPIKLAYEFFLSGGKKMASSKGIGLNGVELLEVLPPELVRFLMIKTRPNQAVEFTPKDTNLLPTLFDEYQKAADAYFTNGDKDYARAFELSQIEEIKKPPHIRFSSLAQWVQMPNMESKIKEEGLEEWATYARIWVERYAPAAEKFLIQKNLPEAVASLSPEQKNYLQAIANELDREWDPEDFQKKIYEISKEMNLPPKNAFAAIYTALIGKDHGPRAAWLLLSLEKDFLKERLTLNG